MSTQTEITRILTARNKLRSKGVELGISTSSDKLDNLAEDFNSIENQGAVNSKIKEGESYTIPAGYHNGGGTVTAVPGGGSYKLQEKTVTPTKKPVSATPDEGFFGLSSVTVNPIPEQYQDVTPVTATATDVLSNKIFVDKAGTPIAGTMPNVGSVSHQLDATDLNQSFAIAKGYHDGTGKVTIKLESKTATPSTSQQTITPTTGSVLNKVTVERIPETYVDSSDADAVAGNILSLKTAYVKGKKITGTMANNGSMDKSLDGLVASTVAIPAGYTTGGTITLTASIENALAEI